MGLKEWLNAQKQKRAERRRAKRLRGAGGSPEELLQLDADTEGIEPPASRYTEEYREFVEKQEAERETAPRACEEE